MLDLECFVISGLKADQTSAAIMAFTFTERHKKEGCVYDYPIGGSQALIDALVRWGSILRCTAKSNAPVTH